MAVGVAASVGSGLLFLAWGPFLGWCGWRARTHEASEANARQAYRSTFRERPIEEHVEDTTWMHHLGGWMMLLLAPIVSLVGLTDLVKSLR